MLRVAFQKMIHNGWMVLCLAAASVLAVALIASIPMYTDAIMQRLLVKDLAAYQTNQGFFPGTVDADHNFYDPEPNKSRLPLYNYITDNIAHDLIPRLGLPVITSRRMAVLNYLLGIDLTEPGDKDNRADMEIAAAQNFKDHITIIHGTMAAPEPVNGVYQVIANEETMQKLDLLLGYTYQVKNLISGSDLFKIKVTGIYQQDSASDVYWSQSHGVFGTSVMMNFDTFEKNFIQQYAQNLTYVYWFNALDYTKIKVRQLPSIVKIVREYTIAAQKLRVDFTFPIQKIIESYNGRAATLMLLLSFLQIPVLLMLAFFIYMVSQLVVQNETNEIAVLRSRGAGGNQIFLLYLIESVALGVGALIIGPWVGYIICSMLGASDGFMKFVQRVALPIKLNLRTYIYGMAGFVLFVVTMLLPVMAFSRSTIVERKRKRSRTGKTVWWKKYLVDFLLIAISLYGLYSYHTRQQILVITGAQGSELPVDPLLFTVSIVFILGAGLLVLRLFPLLIRAIFTLGRRIWGPSAYAAFIHVERSEGTQQFLMIFIILSLSMGVFSSTAARTINRNVEDKIRYANGADITIDPAWTDLSQLQSDTAGPTDSLQAASDTSYGYTQAPEWVEPPFEPYRQLAGVQIATKVYRNSNISVQLPGGSYTSAELMGIIPDEFAKVAWFRNDLLPVNWYNYLNLLASSPYAVLVSTSLQKEYHLKTGDPIMMSWADQGDLQGIIYAFIDYWPGINPRADAQHKYGHQFIVANFSLIHAKMAVEPYQTWIKRIPGTPSKEIFDDIEKKGIKINSISDTSQQIIKAKNDPLLEGTNGVLTLGFLVSIAVSLAGFIVYWILSLKSRTLQFGVIRAMGLRKRLLSRMLTWEHLLISGTAILIGLGIGRLAALLFVPLIQIVYAASQQVPPYLVTSQPSDYIQMYAIGIVMILFGILLFRYVVVKLKVHQALKLGEE